MSSPTSTPTPPYHELRRTFSQPTRHAEERVKQAVVYEAFSRGMWGALYGGVTGGGLMYLANRFNWMGIRGLGVSAKTGIVVTAAVTPFWLRAEMALVEGQRFPERFVVERQHAAATGPVDRRSLPLWQQALNFVYDNPVQTWGLLVVPAYGAIFLNESRNPLTASMPLSQRILHTRVFGQFTALSTLVAIGLTQDTMRRSGGRFELPPMEEDPTVHPLGPEERALVEARLERSPKWCAPGERVEWSGVG